MREGGTEGVMEGKEEGEGTRGRVTMRDHALNRKTELHRKGYSG